MYLTGGLNAGNGNEAVLYYYLSIKWKVHTYIGIRILVMCVSQYSKFVHSSGILRFMPDEITQLQSNFSKFVISIFGIMRTHLFSFSRWPGHLLVSIFLKILRGKRASYLVTIYTHGFTFFPITSIMESGHNPMFSGACMHNRIDQFISGSFFGHGRRSSTNA